MQHLDYEKHCTILQFSCVQAHDEPSPKIKQVAATLDCIYLHPVRSQLIQLGHKWCPYMPSGYCYYNDCHIDWDGWATCQGRWNEQACAAWQRWKMFYDSTSGLYFIKYYVLNEQAYTLHHQSSVKNEETLSSEDIDGIDLDPDNEHGQAVAEE